MAKFMSIEEIAKWYSIDHYLAVRKFRMIDWFRQLRHRQSLLYLLEKSTNKADPLAEEYFSTFSRGIKYTRGIAVEDAEIPDLPSIDGMDLSLTNEKCGATPLTFRHLYNHASSVPGYEFDPVQYFIDMCSVMSENPPPTKTQDPPLLLTNDMSVNGVKYALLRVDQELPIELLRENVIEQLLKMRAAMPPSPKKKRYHTPSFESWARNGLLPYLDLLIFKMETGANIPDRVMAAAIRPGYDIGESNLRKTVIPLAKRLMADGGLAELLELAATEASLHTPINVEN